MAESQSPSEEQNLFPTGTDFLGSLEDSQEHLRIFEQVLRIGLSFKSQNRVRLTPSTTILLTKKFNPAPQSGISTEELLECYRSIAEGCSNWASPSFMGFPDAGNALPAVAASLLVPLLNQNLANQDICAPAATFVEMELVHWLRHVLGYPVPSEYSSVREIGGVLTLGGCLSNTVALMAAKEHTFPGATLHGLPVRSQEVKVLVPEIIEHYSIRSAMAWLGFGEAQVVRVPVDGSFRMRLDKLEECIEHERAQGRHIMACVAYTGDSRSMCVDNLFDVAQVLSKKKVWFHVDACHGSQLAFSTMHRHKIRGIELADSITIDPHKVFWTPNTCSFVLFKDPDALASISTNSDLILKTQWSLGQITPCIGSKAFDALKLWSIIKYFGLAGIEKLIDERLALTRSIQSEISAHKDLVLLNETDINSCMFQYVPDQVQASQLSVADLEKINDINSRIKACIIADGEAYVHGFMLKSCSNKLFPTRCPVYVLRILNGNPKTTLQDVRLLLNRVHDIGSDILRHLEYVVLPESPPLQSLSVFLKLKVRLRAFFGATDHVALIYGSCTSAGNRLYSDVDLMIFAADEFCTLENKNNLKNLFESVMAEEGFPLDNEVPLQVKLLIGFSEARVAAQAKSQVNHGKVIPLERNSAYLSSRVMLDRLIFNVLTVPTILVSGSEDMILAARVDAEVSLVNLIASLQTPSESKQVVWSSTQTAETFVELALTDGTRAGDEYLGYKRRPEIVTHLTLIFHRQIHLSTTSLNLNPSLPRHSNFHLPVRRYPGHLSNLISRPPASSYTASSTTMALAMASTPSPPP